MKLSQVVFFVVLISFTSISNSQDNDSNSDNENYLLHAEPSDRLVTIMQRLFSLIHEEEGEETYTLTQDDMTDLIETVEELLFYAELMSAKVPASELEENESVIFSAMAGKLYDEALNIQQLATSYDFDISDNRQNHVFNEALHRLNRTCSACHQLFRDQ